MSYLLLIQHKNFNFKHIFYFLKSVKGGYLSYLLLIQHKNFNFKHIFYFLKSVKGGPLTNIFATPANFNRPLYHSQDLIRTLNIFTYYLSYLLLIQHKNFNFKHIFYFLKCVKGGPLTKTFPTPANFNRPLYQSQDLIRTLNIFTYYLSSLLLIQHKNFNYIAHFLFSKKCKGGTLDKNFLQLLQTLTGHCTKVRT